MKTFIKVMLLLIPHLLLAAPAVSIERRHTYADDLVYRVAELLSTSATQDQQLTVILESDDFNGPLRQLIASYKGVTRYRRGRSTEIRIAVRQLAQLLKRLPDHVYLRLPYPHQAVAVSQGVELTGAGDFHELQQGGAGVKIGVIDLGFGNYQKAQTAGDLPPNLSIVDYSGEGVGGENHGTSVAEIVHDMAPEAELYLAKVSTSVQLQVAMNDMLAAGVDIINHSVAWFGAAFYDGTGEICETTDSAYSSGMLWVNAMGNSRNAHYLQAFSDTDGDLRHDFSSGSVQNYNTIALTANQSVSLILNWDAYPTTHDVDYNLHLYDHIPANGSVPVVESVNWQRRPYNNRPLEIIRYLPTTTGTYYIVVTKAGNSSPDIPFTLFSNGPSLGIRTASSSMPQPADCHSVLSVGAVNLSDDAEYFSSEGPTIDGRNKPEISAPNRVRTSQVNSFIGTSASSPHVAGTAALLRAQNTSLSAVQLKGALIASVQDVAVSGYDLRTGFGRISLDVDLDGVNHDNDNCPLNVNPNQEDFDADGVGDACDSDIDDDGLSNDEEFILNTDPYMFDTDGDGLSDSYEVNVYFTNPLLVDTDDDGISDGEEVSLYGTDPTTQDTKPVIDDLAVSYLGTGDSVMSVYGSGFCFRECDNLSENTETVVLLDCQQVRVTSISPSEIKININGNISPSKIKIITSFGETKNIVVNADGAYEVGDINRDGVLGVADMLLLQQYVLKNRDFTGDQYAIADIYPMCSVDNYIDIRDFYFLQKVIMSN